jgi:hypothetical protein
MRYRVIAITLVVLVVAAVLSAYYSLYLSCPSQVEVTGDVNVANLNYVAYYMVAPGTDFYGYTPNENFGCASSPQVYSGNTCTVVILVNGLSCPPCTPFRAQNGNNFVMYLKNGQNNPLYVDVTDRNGSFAYVCNVDVNLSPPSRSSVVVENLNC